VKVLIVCARRYNGHELWTTLGVLQESGIGFEVISSDRLIMDEVTFKPNKIQRTIEDVEASELDELDGLMIISGNMDDTEAYWKHPKVLSYVAKAGQRDLAIAAICCSVPTIRGVASGKRVSFFPLVRSRDLLMRAGAILTTVAMTVDGRLVTAEHQMASQIWAEAFVEVLQGKPASVQLFDSGFTPKGSERKPIMALERLKKKGNGA
jgi:putative intracellular protease/amidase